MKAELVRVRGPLGEIVVTDKAFNAVYSVKGFEYIGRAEAARGSVALGDEIDETEQRELLKRVSRLRGKSGEGAVKLAGGDPAEARLLFRAEQSAQNRNDVLEALMLVIGASEG